MVILKSHKIKLSHNLYPKDNKANIASFTELALPDAEENGDDDEIANIAAFNGNRPKFEICFRPHSVKFCPYRGKEFWPPSIKKRANQYNLKHNEFAPKIPPRDPRPPPQTIQESKNGSGIKKKPLVGKQDRATISSLVENYLQEDSTNEVSNKDTVSISAMATRYLEDYDANEHIISTLASLEHKIQEAMDEVELNAHIAAIEENSSSSFHTDEEQDPSYE